MFLVYDKQMNLIPFPDGVKPLDIFISSISKERVSDNIEGVHGSINKGFIYSERSIELELLLRACDTQDYRLVRDAVYAMFSKGDEKYIAEEYQPGKRYLITVDEQFIPERIPNNQRFANAKVNCRPANLPFSESAGTTQDIQKNGVSSDGVLWGAGMGLISDDSDESLKYTHESPLFRIYNAGDESIHPFMQDLKITVSNVVGSTAFFELKNKTNDTVFKTNEAVTNAQKIVLDGPNVTSNGLQYLRKTNKGFIELEPGWNDFSVSGATNAKIEFDFRFYYL